MITIGDFALCQKGKPGIILWKHKCKDKRTNKQYILYSGVSLTGEIVGLNWQSKNPTKITKSQLKKILNSKHKRK